MSEHDETHVSGDDSEGERETLTPGSTLGPYRVLRSIGKGGMGDVYLAEQEKPFRRLAAVKTIRHGMDTARVLARFAYERQALALMEHPNVARVFGAGTTESGRPYFAMEYVDGPTITAYCDDHALTLTTRLELFLQCCAGVQHAHAKGIIHRDLKPTNVLVPEVDGRPLVKIIDFGIARAIDPRLREDGTLTEVGQVVGTPAYMSPEQADPMSVDVDTRSDVYSAGAILYELLCGVVPIEIDEMRRLAFDVMLRHLREVDPQRPSARLTTSGSRSTIADRRRTDADRLIRALRGDLDVIAMKALERDRSRRYGSMRELAEDVERFLRSEPIHARPRSRVYVARRFVRRHRMGVALGGSVAVSLVALGSILIVQNARIRQGLDAVARGQAAAEDAVQFLSALLDATSPTGGMLPNAQSVDELLGSARQRLLGSRPSSATAAVRAQVADRLGSAYHQRRRLKDAREVLESGLSEARDSLGPDDRLTLRVANQLAYLYTSMGLCDDALQLHLDVLTRQQHAFGADDPETLWSLNNLAYAYQSQGRYAKAEPLHRETLECRRRVLGPDARATLLSRRHLGWVLSQQGRLREAEAEMASTREACHRLFGSEDRDTIESDSVYASIVAASGRRDVAGRLAGDAYRRCSARYGPQDPLTIATVERWSDVTGDDGAETLLRNAIAVADGHPEWDTGVLVSLLTTLTEFKPSPHDFERLLPLVREASARCRSNAAAANAYAWLLLTAQPEDLRDVRAALRAALHANEIAEGTSANYLHTLAVAHAMNGQMDAARDCARRGLALLPDEQSADRAQLETALRDWSAR